MPEDSAQTPAKIAPEINSLTPNPSKPPFKWLAIAAIVVALLAGGVYLYRSGYSIELGGLKLGGAPTPTPAPFAAPTPIPTSSATIENCQMTKESDKIVEAVGTVDDKTVGIFRGHIQEIKINGPEIVLTLISEKGEQLQLFKFSDDSQLFYDTKQLQYLKSSDLKIGDTLFMSFECDPKAVDKKPQFTRIAVTGSLNL